MLKLGILFVLFLKCSAFDLDDVEYDKMPPLFTLDDYDRCLLYNGTYCVIRTELFAEPENQLFSMMKSYTKSSRVKHYNHTYLNKGLCLTTTCRDIIGAKDLNTNENLHEILERCENQTYYEKYGLQAKVTDVLYCDTNETRVDKKDLLDWIVLAFLAFIIIVNLAATYYDSMLDEKSMTKLTIKKSMFLCFSIKRNWNFLMAPPSKDPHVAKLDGINFIRTAASFMMVLGHVVWIFVMGFMDNPHDFERSYNEARYQVIYNGMIVVQIFFVISGFLLIYNLETAAEIKRLSWKVLPVMALRRFFRLAPPMALIIALNATWIRFINSGPLWKLYVHSMVNDCRKWWWSHLMFINNYLTDNKYCTVQTWHTAADTQVFYLAVVLYIAVKPRARGVVTAAFFLLSMVVPALHVYFQDLNAQMMKTPEMLRSLDDPNRYPYVFAHNNLCGFLLGMVTAYKVYHWQKQGIKFSETVTRLIYGIFIPVTVATFLTGNVFHEEDYRSPLWMRMLWQGTHRLFICLPIAAALAAMVIGTQISDGVPGFIKWPGFSITGKLTYAVFLLHESFTPIIAGSKTTLVHFDYMNLLIYQFGIVAFTYLLSVPFYLMVEAPMTPLLMLVLMKPKPEDATKPDLTKNFLADVIQHKTNKRKQHESENIDKATEIRNNTLNELLLNAAKEIVKEKES